MFFHRGAWFGCGAPFVAESTQRCQDIFLNKFLRILLTTDYTDGVFLTTNRHEWGSGSDSESLCNRAVRANRVFLFLCLLLLLVFALADFLSRIRLHQATKRRATRITDGFSAGASERRSKSVEEDKGGRNLRPDFFATLCKITKSLFCSLASVKNLR